MRVGTKLALMAMFGALLALLPGAALAEGPAPRCFKVRAQGGTIQQICESAGFVTIETRGRDVAGDDAPSPEVSRAHALKQFADTGTPGTGTPDATPPLLRDAGLASWSGLRVGAGPWGALTHASDRGSLGLLGRIGYDIAADGPAPLVLGVALQESALPGGCRVAAVPRAGAPCAVTSLDLRLGYVVRDRVMPYVMVGLASRTQHFSPLSGGSEVGAGIAYALDARWSLNLDYRHVALTAWGSPLTAATLGLPRTRPAVDGFDATLNYRFL